MKKFLLFILFWAISFNTAVFSQNINIAFTIDNNYPIFTMLVINSIIKNNYNNNDYTFYIIENNLTNKNKSKIENFVKYMNQKSVIIHYDTYNIDNGKNFYRSLKNPITRIGMARIMLPKLLPDNIHRIIYLDGDILVTDDISQLYNIDLENKSTGMVVNITKQENKLFPYLKRYYNSGVIVMDVDKWREKHITDQMLDFINNNKNAFLNTEKISFLYPDQDLINIILKDDIKTLPQRWNIQTSARYTTKADSIGIYHFIGINKPWLFPRTKQKYYQIYYDYWNDSTLRNYKYYYCLKAMIYKYATKLKIYIR